MVEFSAVVREQQALDTAVSVAGVLVETVDTDDPVGCPLGKERAVPRRDRGRRVTIRVGTDLDDAPGDVGV